MMTEISAADIARGRTALVMVSATIERDVRLHDLTPDEERAIVVAILEATRRTDPGIPMYRFPDGTPGVLGVPTDQASWSPERIKQEEARQAELLAEQQRKL